MEFECARCEHARTAAKKQKRLGLGNNDVLCVQRAAADDEPKSLLLAMPREVLEHILSHLDAHSLAGLSLAAKAFRSFDRHSGLRLVDKIAKAAVVEATGSQAERWRRRSWLSRLHIEDAGVGFAKFHWTHPNAPPVAGQPPAYKFTAPANPGSNLHIKLEGMGPKLLVSDVSTADQPILRWRLVVRGNTAVEFGVVPLCMVDDDKSLHKCQQEEKKFERLAGPLADRERPTGFCSSITVGSMLPFKTAIMKGSVVEMLARRGRLEVLVQNPPDGQELYWHNTRTVPKPYKGPREVRFEQDFSPHHDVKLALTSWAHGAFDVLHAAPGSRQGGRDWGPGSAAADEPEPVAMAAEQPADHQAGDGDAEQQPEQQQQQDDAQNEQQQGGEQQAGEQEAGEQEAGGEQQQQPPAPCAAAPAAAAATAAALLQQRLHAATAASSSAPAAAPASASAAAAAQAGAAALPGTPPEPATWWLNTDSTTRPRTFFEALTVWGPVAAAQPQPQQQQPQEAAEQQPQQHGAEAAAAAPCEADAAADGMAAGSSSSSTSEDSL